MQVSENAVHVLHHTLGLTESRREPYRNHFVAEQGHHEMPALEELEEAGLMVRGRTPKFLNQQAIVFMCTEDGKSYAIENLPPEPKRTKYDDWLSADCGASFAEWLGIDMPRINTRVEGGKREFKISRIRWCTEISGEWAATKNAAKASYKAALKARAQQAKRTEG